MTSEVKDINYWKNNCEEDYITTPISVLRYISELEKLVALPQQEICISCDEKKETHKICMDCIGKMIKENQQEISDEEIKKFADEQLGTIRTDFDFGVIQGMKWYREQLKKTK